MKYPFGDLIAMSKYTTILYDVKKELGVTLAEYVYLDTVYHLQIKSGFAFASSAFYCERMDITDRQLRRVKGAMVERGYLEIIPNTKDRKVKVTDRFLEIIQADKMSAHADKMSVPSGQNVRHSIENEKKNEIRYSAEQKYHPQTNNVIDLFRDIAPTTYTRWYRITSYRTNITELLKVRTFEQVAFLLNSLSHPEVRKDDFAPQITNPYELLTKFDKTLAYLQKKSRKLKEEAERVF